MLTIIPDVDQTETLRAAERRLQAAQLTSDIVVLTELIDDAASFTGGNWDSHTSWAPCVPCYSLHLDIVRGMEVGARITAKGQVTIPAAVRRALDLDKGDEVIFEVDLGPGTPHAQVRKAADFMALAGSVPVPAKWADAEWPSVRAAAWSARADRHDHPA